MGIEPTVGSIEEFAQGDLSQSKSIYFCIGVEDLTVMAIEPKSPRKRAAKKSKSKAGSENKDVSVVAPAPEAEAAPKTRKRAAAIPVPIFQAAEATDAPAKAPRRAKAKSGEEKSAAEDSAPAVSATGTAGDDSDSDPRNRNRRRRRGGGSSGGSSGEKKQGRGAEGTCHQACAISGQPVVPPERRLLWRTAPTATKIHRPSPNCAAGCGRITSCRGVHRGGRGRQRASEMNNRVNKMWSESSGDYLASRRPLR